MTDKQKIDPENTGAAEYEKSDVDPKGLFISALVTIVVVIIIIVAMNEIFISTKEQQIYKSVLSVESIELRELRARETSVLTGYKVLDEKKGIYRIPIDRAMQLEADKAFQKKMQNINIK